MGLPGAMNFSTWILLNCLMPSNCVEQENVWVFLFACILDDCRSADTLHGEITASRVMLDPMVRKASRIQTNK